jgi:aminobenzoyl-glutamate utilization protein B
VPIHRRRESFRRGIAEELAAGHALDPASTGSIEPLRPFDPHEPAASTDVGDVRWNVPTTGFIAATFVPGVVPHTWQAAACAGMSIGQKGMLVAAKARALTGVDLFSNPQLVQDARKDFARQLAGKTYKSEIPDGQQPPLDYRF